MRSAVVIPVKAFSDAKRRLAAVLSGAERERLARAMAERVVAAAGTLPVFVVCDDDAVRDWSLGVGAEALWTPNLGLDGAVEAGVAHVTDLGAQRVLVAHADLPFAQDLVPFLATTGVLIVPDRRNDGTNVISIPTGRGFRFSYGVGSFRRHVDEAARLGLDVEVLTDPGLGWDVDVPDDLEVPGVVELASEFR